MPSRVLELLGYRAISGAQAIGLLCHLCLKQPLPFCCRKLAIAWQFAVARQLAIARQLAFAQQLAIAQRLSFTQLQPPD